jgi:hypothetical protein
MRAIRLPPTWVALALLALTRAVPAAGEEDTTKGSEYLVRAGGCVSSHTVPAEQKFAGGRALKTPFGTFYSPNITPDPDTGIGGWTDTTASARSRRFSVTLKKNRRAVALTLTVGTVVSIDANHN